MESADKLAMIMALLEIGSSDTQESSKIAVYLNAAEREILAWRYSYASEKPETVPEEYEMTQVYAVVAGYSQSGAENQRSHSENGVSRTFKHEDMIAYIRAHVVPIVKVI